MRFVWDTNYELFILFLLILLFVVLEACPDAKLSGGDEEFWNIYSYCIILVITEEKLEFNYYIEV